MSAFHPALAYPSSDATFGETETYLSSQTDGEGHYEEGEIDVTPSNLQENGFNQDTSKFEFPVTLRNPESSFPRNRTEFILNLDQTEINRVLDPINSQILSADTVFSLRDARCGLSLAISGQEILEILENNGRTVNLESPYENEKVDYNLEKKSRRCRLALFWLLTSFIVLVIAVIVTLIILRPWETDPPVFPITNGSLPVIVVFGGVQGNGINIKNLPLNTIELYYIENSRENQILKTPLLTPRFGHVSGRLGDNVIVAGGSNDHTTVIVSNQSALSSVEVFSLINGSITFGPSMKYKRFAAAGAIYADAFFVCGGVYSSKSFLDYEDPDLLVSKECEVLDNIYSKWRLISPMNNYRPMLNSIVPFQNFLYIIGPTIVKSNRSDEISGVHHNFSAEKYGPIDLNGFNKTPEWCPALDFFNKTSYDIVFSVSALFCDETSIITCIMQGVGESTETKCMSYSENNKEVTKINSLDQASAGGYIFVPVNMVSHGCAIYALGGQTLDIESDDFILDKVSILTSGDKCIGSKPCWIAGPKLKEARDLTSAVVIE